MRRALLTLCAVAMTALCGATPASAYWTSSGSGTGSATTATMPAGPTPSGSVSGRTVTVSFNQVSFLGSDLGSIAGGGYEVLRYPAGGGAAVTPGGTCGALVTGAAPALSCDETSTPPGHWRYTVTPILYSWTGAESSVSAVQAVAPDAPATASSSWLPAADIALSWSAVPGVTGYNVYRRTNPGSYNYSSPLNGGTLVTGTTFDDTTSVSGTAYNYEVRAVFEDGTPLESTSSPETTTLTADATTPTAVTIVDPGTPLRGTIALNGSASDTISGIASLQFEYKPSAGSTWSTACTDTTAPYSCDFDTTFATDGLNDFRVVATDLAGNSTTSASVTNRVIDNTAPVVTMTDPGTHIRATVMLSASSTDTGGSGVTAMTIQRSPVGAGSWTNVCTSVTAAVSCNFNTTTVLDGDYDFRATSTDAAGNIGYSTTYTPVRVDNTRPTAADIQTINAGTLGRPEAGDQVVYTFSEPMRASSILAGFTGASMNVTVRINNVGGNDRLLVYNAANTTASTLGEVRLGGNYVAANRTFTNSTISMSGSTITVTLGTASGAVNTVAGNATLDWRPLATALDVAGNQMMTTARLETGAADPNF